MLNRNVVVDVLAVLFGVGAWVSINGLWVELPLLVQELPEGWNLPSYLSIIIQVANIGPLIYSIWRFSNSSGRPVPAIYSVLLIGCVSSLLLAFLWDHTSLIRGVNHSTNLFIFVFFLALVDCTSSVLYIPYMANWRNIYLPSYLIGEGLSGLLPSLVALGQGAGGNGECQNFTDENGTTSSFPKEISPNFSIDVFFFVLFGMMAASSLAFILLEQFPFIQNQRVRENDSIQSDSKNVSVVGSTELLSRQTVVVKRRWSFKSYLYILLLVTWACLLSNGLLPSIQSYSCAPYGFETYHLAATLSALSNPLAALSTMILSRATFKKIGLLSLLGTIFAVYIFVTAIMSPTPPLVRTTWGSALIIIVWVLFSGIISYVRVEIANLVREEGEKPLFWAGIVTQAGSAVGALIAFLLVNYTSTFTPYYPCG